MSMEALLRAALDHETLETPAEEQSDVVDTNDANATDTENNIDVVQDERPMGAVGPIIVDGAKRCVQNVSTTHNTYSSYPP